MPDWTSSMQQTYEFYMVDPKTWKDSKRLTNIKTGSINRDSQVETLGSASFDVTESVGECYIRTYLVTIQNGVREKIPLGTHLVQTPSSSFDGKIRNVTMDAYTPLLELKEKMPPLGYFIPKGENILDWAYRLTRENLRAPVVKPTCRSKLDYDFVADPDDTWISYLNEFMANTYVAGLSNINPDKTPEPEFTFDLDEMGRVLFAPKQDISSMQPVWTYDEGNSSILYPELNMDHDLYMIPNVIEVVYSNGSKNLYAKIVNDDPNSPVSTVNRGRDIIRRITDPNVLGDVTPSQLNEYAKRLLKELSSPEYTITYTHGYCPVRVGDCVRINYPRAGLKGIKAKVISQDIKLEPGCPVTEKAVFTTKLWG